MLIPLIAASVSGLAVVGVFGVVIILAVAQLSIQTVFKEFSDGFLKQVLDVARTFDTIE